MDRSGRDQTANEAREDSSDPLLPLLPLLSFLAGHGIGLEQAA